MISQAAHCWFVPRCLSKARCKHPLPQQHYQPQLHTQHSLTMIHTFSTLQHSLHSDTWRNSICTVTGVHLRRVRSFRSCFAASACLARAFIATFGKTRIADDSVLHISALCLRPKEPALGSEGVVGGNHPHPFRRERDRERRELVSPLLERIRSIHSTTH